jgi:hypothetical protein
MDILTPMTRIHEEEMTWGAKLMYVYVCAATGLFSGALAHEAFRTGLGIRKPLFCPFWEKGYCTECKKTITAA